MPALRVVEMQLNTAAAAGPDEEFATGSHPQAVEMSASMAEFENRRCAVCGGRHPTFGFGPPLHGTGTIWACSTHRAEVNRQLRATGSFSRTAIGGTAAPPIEAGQEHGERKQQSLF